MIESGKKVKVHYKGTLADGSVFDSSEGRDPLEFETGSGQVIPGFDSAVCGMETGATATVTIPCTEAYGDVRDEMVATIPKTNFPEDIKPEVGQTLQMNTEQGPLPVQVTAVTDEGVTIDGNHPLAGKDLTFELTLVAVD